MAALKLVFKLFLTIAAEQQPCCVQVVEWVGLVALFRAVFAEEVGCFGLLLWHDGLNLRLHGMKLLTLTT